jgi:hypothetical protein
VSRYGGVTKLPPSLTILTVNGRRYRSDTKSLTTLSELEAEGWVIGTPRIARSLIERGVVTIVKAGLPKPKPGGVASGGKFKIPKTPKENKPVHHGYFEGKDRRGYRYCTNDSPTGRIRVPCNRLANPLKRALKGKQKLSEEAHLDSKTLTALAAHLRSGKVPGMHTDHANHLAKVSDILAKGEGHKLGIKDIHRIGSGMLPGGAAGGPGGVAITLNVLHAAMPQLNDI